MRTKKFEQIIAKGTYKNYFEKVPKENQEFLWSSIEADTLTKVPINAFKSLRQNGYAVVMNGVGSQANLFVLLADWSAWKSKPEGDNFATLMPKVAEIEKFLEENK
jgi:hypothetical protein|tara:strand:+ start:443 stop:760 length:318 start_codon:yes stop_codon:yes gene_type:complete